jgi:lysophospholipase L1-like esterase
MRRKGLVGLALVVTATAATLAFAEIAARLVAPGWSPLHAERNFWQHDAHLGWAHVPGRQGVFRHPDFEVGIAISAQGLRDREYPFERTPGRSRMLVLGDSFAWGFGVEAKQGFSEILESRRPDWEIVNAAVSGYGTDQELLFLEERGLRWNPDVVLLLLHPNDFDDNAAAARYGYPKPRFALGADGLELTNVPVPPLGLRARLHRALLQRSFVYHRVHLARSAWSESRATHPPSPAAEERAAHAGSEAGGRPSAQPARDSKLELIAALLARLHQRAASAGARLVVVSAPSPPRVREFLYGALAEQGVPYVPLDEAFGGLPREETHFARDPHWNAEGQRVAADAIEDFLVELGVFR